MKYAEIAFLPFYDGALQFHIRRCARGSGRSRFRLLRAFFDRNTICPRYCIPATLLRQYDKMRGLFFVFRGRTTPDPTKTRPSNVTDTRGVPFSILYVSVPRPPLPVIPSDARRNARLRERAVKSAHEPIGVKYRHERKARLQEHFDAAHEPHRGEVSKARNPPAHYPLRGDPSTSLRSVFGMTYEADGRFPPPSPLRLKRADGGIVVHARR